MGGIADYATETSGIRAPTARVPAARAPAVRALTGFFFEPLAPASQTDWKAARRRCEVELLRDGGEDEALSLSPLNTTPPSPARMPLPPTPPQVLQPPLQLSVVQPLLYVQSE
jgi:hypothetical protein